MNEDNITNMKGHLQPGALLQGNKYRIDRFIASGGFGCTYEGTHIMLKKRVAIKEFFVKELCNRDETNGHVVLDTVSRKTLVEKLRDKFIREAQGLCEFKHPGIVNVSDIFEENGTAYFVMDYIDGCTLADIVDKRGRLPEAEAVGYIRQVAEALRQVHAKNRLHLDIKAANIMVDKDNRAILIDFGASKQYDSQAGQNTSTLLGYTCGYAPPEQMSNSVKNFHASTDLYALGATLYKLVTGDTPPDSMTILSEGDIEIPDHVSPAVANAIRCAMQTKRKERPQSVDEFLALLDDKAAPAPAPAPAPVEPAQSKEQKSETTVLNPVASKPSSGSTPPPIPNNYKTSSGMNRAPEDGLTPEPPKESKICRWLGMNKVELCFLASFIVILLIVIIVSLFRYGSSEDYYYDPDVAFTDTAVAFDEAAYSHVESVMPEDIDSMSPAVEETVAAVAEEAAPAVDEAAAVVE